MVGGVGWPVVLEEALPVPLSVALAEVEGDAQGEGEAEGGGEGVELALGHRVTVATGEAQGEAVREGDSGLLAEAAVLREGSAEAEPGAVTEALREGLLVGEAVPQGEPVLVGDALLEGLPDAEANGETLLEREAEGKGELDVQLLGEAEGGAVEEPVAVLLAVADGEAVGLAVPVPHAVPPRGGRAASGAPEGGGLNRSGCGGKTIGEARGGSGQGRRRG